MPKGGKGKPAGGYHAGSKGSYGCDGYPTVSADGTVHGCHPTKAKAAAQARAIFASINSKKSIELTDIEKAATSFQEGDFVIVSCDDEIHVGRVEYVMTTGASGLPGSEYYLETSPEEPALVVRTLEFDSDGQYWEETMYLVSVAAEEATKIAPLPLDAEAIMVDGQVVPDPETMPTMDAYDNSIGKSDCCPDELQKQAPCWDGYVQRGMKPGEGGRMVPNCVPAAKADDIWEDDDSVVYDTDSVNKAEGYSPPAGARAAARRAIKFKEDGKANGAGTSVGWTRAGQLARGETLSLSTVKRMYSYFSRHEVDKKGKNWANQSDPSNGYIMWLAWGGDAGFSWSRGIVEREKKKADTTWVGSAFSFRKK